ncbi:MAG TPA: hypothetical protein VMU18_08880 [Rhodoblastus sp.]|nr:hypothetical protein [Rhodoblastus sp.]
MASDPRDKLTKKSKDLVAKGEPAPACGDRDTAILNMRLHGLTFHEIARQLPEVGFRRVSVSRVHAIVAKSLRSCRDQPARELRQLELLRLDQLQAAHYKAAMGGDAAAISRVLSIMDRRARLLGLDAGPEAAVSLDGARQTLLKKLEALARVQSDGRAADPLK